MLMTYACLLESIYPYLSGPTHFLPGPHFFGELLTMSSPFNLPPAVFTLVTDELSAPADFVLHQAVNNWLKERRAKPPVAKDDGSVFTEVLILSAFEDTSRWKAIASKSVRFVGLVNGCVSHACV